MEHLHVSTRIQTRRTLKPKNMFLKYGVISTQCNCIGILVLTTMKMVTWVAETCLWLLCNKITFIHPRAFVGFLNKIIIWQYSVCNCQFLTFVERFGYKIGGQTGPRARFLYYVWATFVCVTDPVLRLMCVLLLLSSPHIPVIHLIALRSLV